ncbi:hypothetical protein BSKO_00911 [Bryopsis sp. KO-2023]|nr:hypothetical protein BSKO_00911 [Bryopsis sp. KO-2023]
MLSLGCPLRHSLIARPSAPSRTASFSPIRHGQAKPAGTRLRSASDEYYNGQFGAWKVEPEDEREVLFYRLGLTCAAASLGLGVAASFLPAENAVNDALFDALCVTGAGGLGVSLVLIHIYVTPLKRFLQGLYGVGVAGGLWLLLTQDQSVPAYVVDNPSAMWLVGPLFAAVTGVAFKEGICYQKWEAGVLFFLIPIIMLGHLYGIWPDENLHVMMGGFAALFALFAGRKYTQPVKDDIGDKSVFTFMKLPPEEQEKKIRELRSE